MKPHSFRLWIPIAGLFFLTGCYTQVQFVERPNYTDRTQPEGDYYGGGQDRGYGDKGYGDDGYRDPYGTQDGGQTGNGEYREGFDDGYDRGWSDSESYFFKDYTAERWWSQRNLSLSYGQGYRDGFFDGSFGGYYDPFFDWRRPRTTFSFRFGSGFSSYSSWYNTYTWLYHPSYGWGYHPVGSVWDPWYGWGGSPYAWGGFGYSSFGGGYYHGYNVYGGPIGTVVHDRNWDRHFGPRSSGLTSSRASQRYDARQGVSSLNRGVANNVTGSRSQGRTSESIRRAVEMSRDRGRLGTSRVIPGTSIYRGTTRGDVQVRRGTRTRTDRGYVAPRSRDGDRPRVSTGRSSGGSRGSSSSSRSSSPRVKRGGDSGKSTPTVRTKRSTGRSSSGSSGGSKRSGGSRSGGSSENKRSRGGGS
ncbi:MAG: hypothetical protein RI513_04810 [Balneolaceae bacterium]|nr:hypothetical protein [Balneolaceae bacterium]